MTNSIFFVACGVVIGFGLPFVVFLSLVKTESNEENYSAESNQNFNDAPLAQKLFNEVRLLCWVMTQPENHESKAIYIKRTWGKRCNKLLFMSSTKDMNLDTVALPVSEGRDNLWDKTKKAFEYVYRNHFDDYDWFMKADDDK